MTFTLWLFWFHLVSTMNMVVLFLVMKKIWRDSCKNKIIQNFTFFRYWYIEFCYHIKSWKRFLNVGYYFMQRKYIKPFNYATFFASFFSRKNTHSQDGCNDCQNGYNLFIFTIKIIVFWKQQFPIFKIQAGIIIILINWDLDQLKRYRTIFKIKYKI